MLLHAVDPKASQQKQTPAQQQRQEQAKPQEQQQQPKEQKPAQQPAVSPLAPLCAELPQHSASLHWLTCPADKEIGHEQLQYDVIACGRVPCKEYSLAS